MSLKKIIKKVISRLPRTSFKNITKEPDVVFFDYDGTISDNSEYIVPAFKYAIKKNINRKIRKKIMKIKKDSDRWLYIKENVNDKFALCNKDYDEYLKSCKFKSIKNIEKVLKLFKRYNKDIYIVSQKSGEGLREELKKSGLNNYFNYAYGTLDFGEIQKPSKEFADAVIQDTRTKTKKCWVIGDRRSDVVMAQNFGGIAFIIDKSEAKQIQQDFNDIIGKEVFFTSYLRLYRFLKHLHKKSKN